MSACTICGRESSTCPGHLRDAPDLRAETRRLHEELNLIESNYIAMKSQHDTVCRANEEITQERDAAIARAESSDRRNEHLQMQLTQALANGEKADCKLATLRAQLAASEAQVERMRGALKGITSAYESSDDYTYHREVHDEDWVKVATSTLTKTPSDALRAHDEKVWKSGYEEGLHDQSGVAFGNASIDEAWQQSATRRELGEGA